MQAHVYGLHILQASASPCPPAGRQLYAGCFECLHTGDPSMPSPPVLQVTACLQQLPASLQAGAYIAHFCGFSLLEPLQAGPCVRRLGFRYSGSP